MVRKKMIKIGNQYLEEPSGNWDNVGKAMAGNSSTITLYTLADDFDESAPATLQGKGIWSLPMHMQ